MKKILVIITVLMLLVGCTNTKETKQVQADAAKFKEEYESLNNESNNGKTYRSLEIDDNNPITYQTVSDIIEAMDDKESFVIYFGFAECPWCRSVVPTLIEVANDLGISNIYYVDVKEIRDTLELDDEGNIVTKKEGTEDYYKLLEKLDSVLETYLLTDADGNDVNTGEKRIYAPNIISVIDGEAKYLTDGSSSSQTDAYMDLTDEMKEESYDKIKCSIECVADNQKTCSAKTKC